MVQPYGRPNPSPQHLPTPSSLQQDDTKPLPLPRHCLRSPRRLFLALYPGISECLKHYSRSGRAFLFACCIWPGDFVFGRAEEMECEKVARRCACEVGLVESFPIIIWPVYIFEKILYLYDRICRGLCCEPYMRLCVTAFLNFPVHLSSH